MVDDSIHVPLPQPLSLTVHDFDRAAMGWMYYSESDQDEAHFAGGIIHEMTHRCVTLQKAMEDNFVRYHPLVRTGGTPESKPEIGLTKGPRKPTIVGDNLMTLHGVYDGTVNPQGAMYIKILDQDFIAGSPPSLP